MYDKGFLFSSSLNYLLKLKPSSGFLPYGLIMGVLFYYSLNKTLHSTLGRGRGHRAKRDAVPTHTVGQDVQFTGGKGLRRVCRVLGGWGGGDERRGWGWGCAARGG